MRSRMVICRPDSCGSERDSGGRSIVETLGCRLGKFGVWEEFGNELRDTGRRSEGIWGELNAMRNESHTRTKLKGEKEFGHFIRTLFFCPVLLLS